MRSSSSIVAQRRVESAQQVAWLLTLESGAWSWRGATMGCLAGEETFSPRLKAMEVWRETLPEGMPGGRVRAMAKVRVIDGPGAADSLKGRLAVTPPVGIEATLRLAWLGEGPMALTDAPVMLRGRLTDWALEAGTICLELHDELAVQASRHVGRLLRPEMCQGAGSSPALGKSMPWIFGLRETVDLVPLRTGVSACLEEELDEISGRVKVESLEGFPPRGGVQIGAETIYYDAIDREARTLGTDDYPVSRGVPVMSHKKGSVVRELPVGGFVWLVADHACVSVSDVRGDGRLVDGWQWGAETMTLDGVAVQTVRIATWPLDEDDRPVRTITARVEGLADGEGQLVENPAGVIETLLTHGRLAGLEPGRIDAVGFASARQELAAREYRFARRLTGSETLGDLLDGCCREAGVWLGQGDPIRLRVADPTPQSRRVEAMLDHRHILAPLAPAQIHAPANYIPPDSVELAGTATGRAVGRASYQFPGERGGHGVIPRRFELKWLDLGRATAAGDLGELYWSWLGEAPYVCGRDFPIGMAMLEAGETVRLSDDTVEMVETLGWVSRVEAGPGARAQVTLTGPWAGDYVWRDDLDNYIRRYAFGGQMVFVIGGRPVARLSREGTLRLAGTVREETPVGGGPFAEPIALDGRRLVFGLPGGGLYDPFMALDGEGNLTIDRTIRERSTRVIDPEGASFGSADGRFWLSTDSLAGGAQFEGSEGILHLKGIVIESLRL